MPLNASATFSLGADITTTANLLLQLRKADATPVGAPLSGPFINEGSGVFTWVGTVADGSVVSAKLYRSTDPTVTFSIRSLILTTQDGGVIEEPPPPGPGVQPLFVQTKDILKANLRLSSAASSDALSIIDEAIFAARIEFYDRLPEDRITYLLSVPLTDHPTTKDGVLRLKASLLETSIVRLRLMRKLPVLFMDGSANSMEVWNQEGLTRAGMAEHEINRLAAEIEEYFGTLGWDEAKASSVSVSTIGPDYVPPRPGDSIRYPVLPRSIFNA